jgi:zinc protease
MVAVGTTRRNPDYFALSVFNEAFGGGFSSRLFGDIRTTKGLAYAVGGGVGSGWDHPGMLRLVVSTKSKTTIESIQAIDEEIADLAKRPIDDEEIKRAKDSILNSFVFRFDSPAKVLQEKMAYEFYGYPLDFLESFQRGIETVKKEDVARVAAKYLHREQLAVLVVGNVGEFDKPLSSLGTLNKIDIAIPAPPPGLMPEQGEHP